MQPSHVDVLGHGMAYRRAGSGRDVLFLHGNPTSSLLWADVVADLSDAYCCTALDLIGMGDSDRLPGTGDERYGFGEHARYLDAAVRALGLDRDVVLVGHDWGGVLAVDWARRHPGAVRGLAYLEAGVVPVSWREGTGPDPGLFGALRGPDGERMVLQENLFVEVVLQAGTQRTLTAAELDAYRRPFAVPGEDRRAMLTWARQIPIDGNPPEVHDRVAAGAEFLAASPLPKLLVSGEPGAVVTGAVLEACRRWPRQREVVVPGTHFLPHDASPAIAAALRAWLEEEVTV
ncbi:haloalkane dehalogenase [Kineococcus sp. DHX-1]|uniref:haloalkane dehalogenase n=1 Tax=Kineococcus sp. DHX-1 TaxID=3349638 RepID=UPI0036D26093